MNRNRGQRKKKVAEAQNKTTLKRLTAVIASSCAKLFFYSSTHDFVNVSPVALLFKYFLQTGLMMGSVTAETGEEFLFLVGKFFIAYI